jgi:hypothetical protein
LKSLHSAPRRIVSHVSTTRTSVVATATAEIRIHVSDSLRWQIAQHRRRASPELSNLVRSVAVMTVVMTAAVSAPTVITAPQRVPLT